MQPTTNLRIITIVVLSIALDSMIGIGTLAYCMMAQIKPDPTLITAFVGITSGLVGALTGLLVNTRTSPTTPSDTTIYTTTTTTNSPQPNGEPTPVLVTNPPDNPVPTAET